MKNVVPKLRQEVEVKVDIVTSDDIKIYYTGKFQDFTATYIIECNNPLYDAKEFQGNIYISLYWSKAALASTSSLRNFSEGIVPSSRGGS